MKRLYFTVKLLAVLLVVDACLKCNDDVLPYFDYQELTMHYRNGKEIYVGRDFVLSVRLDGFNYLAENNSFGMIPTMMATQPCTRNGYDGVKYPLDSVRIISESDWDPDHPAGNSLNDVFYVEQWWDYDGEEYIQLGSNQGIPLVEAGSTVFQARTFPAQSLEHVFHLTYYKSNGELVEGVTDTITWVP